MKRTIGWICTNDSPTASLECISVVCDGETIELQIADDATDTIKRSFSFTSYNQCMEYMYKHVASMETFLPAGSEFGMVVE